MLKGKSLIDILPPPFFPLYSLHCLADPAHIISHRGIITFELPLLTVGSPRNNAFNPIRPRLTFVPFTQPRQKERAPAIPTAAVLALRPGTEHVLSEKHLGGSQSRSVPTDSGGVQ